MTYDPAVHHRRSIRLKGYDYSQAGAYYITICTHQRQPFFGNIVRAGLAPAQMKLNEYGQIAHEQWQKIPARFETIELDSFIIMPNHIHGILIIHDPVGAGFTPAQNTQNDLPGIGQPQGLPLQNSNDAGFTPAPFLGTPTHGGKMPNTRVGASPTPTVNPSGQPVIGQPQGLPRRVTGGDVVGAYKSLVANECLKIYKTKNETMGNLWQRNYYEHIIRDEKSYLKIAQYILGNPVKWELDSFYPGGPP